jgi:DNA-binding transcriptional MerR regulator
MLRIGEFSTLSQTSIKTLRYYDEIALFRPSHVDPDSGYRKYSADQVGELAQILHLKTLGFSLREIRQIVNGNRDNLRATLTSKRNAVMRRIRDEQLRLAVLDGWLERTAHEANATARVTLKRIGAQPIASIRKAVNRYSDAAELFDELASHVRKSGGQAGPPAALWHTCGEAGHAIDCEAYVPVRRHVTGSRRVRVYQLPATTWASIVHAGDSASSSRAYGAARSWIAAHGLVVSGPKRELYWRGGLEGDRATDVTEIQFAVAMAEPAVNRGARE